MSTHCFRFSPLTPAPLLVFLCLCVSASCVWSQEYVEDDIETDTLDAYVSDELLQLELRPLDLGTCSVDQLARLPGMGIGLAAELLDAIDRGEVRTWTQVRHALEIDRATLRLLQIHTRLPRHRHDKPATAHFNLEAGIALPPRRGARDPVMRVTSGRATADTITVGTRFVGSALSTRLEGVLASGVATIAFRGSKDSWEPWFFDDTLGYTYSGSVVTSRDSLGDSVVRRRGGSVGVSATVDQADWGLLVGDYRVTTPAATGTLLRSSADVIRRLLIPGTPVARASPSFSEDGFLRGILLRLGAAYGRTTVPNIDIGVTERDYASAASSPTDISTDGIRRTRSELRRAGGVHEEGVVVAARWERRRWGADIQTQRWVRRSTFPIVGSAAGEFIGGSLWHRVGNGLARTGCLVVSRCVIATAGILLPVGSRAEVAGIGRYVINDARIVIPGGASLPRQGMEWMVAGSWRASRYELTEVSVGSREMSVGSSAPFGGMTTYVGLTRTERETSALRRVTLRLETTPAAASSSPDSRLRDREEIRAHVGYRSEWWNGPVRIGTDLQLSFVDQAGERRGIASAAAASVAYRWGSAFEVRGRVALFDAESPATIYDVAPSYRGRSMPLTLGGRGARLNIELRHSLWKGIVGGLGIEHRNRTDRSRVADSGDDQIDSPDVTTIWASAQLRP